MIKEILKKLYAKETECVLKANANEPVQFQKWMMKSFGFRDAQEIVQEVAKEHESSNAAQEIRNKVIDEFVGKLEEYYFQVEDSVFRPYLKDINLVSEANIRKIAEQLKNGCEKSLEDFDGHEEERE